MTESEVTAQETTVNEKNEQQKSLEQKYKSANYEQQLSELKSEREGLKKTQKKQYDTIRQLNGEASRRSELKLKRTEHSKKEDMIKEL